jgi:hypothetical protein
MRGLWRVTSSLCVLGILLGAAGGGVAAAQATSTQVSPPVRHVWLFMLENHSYPENFGQPATAFKPRLGSPASMQYLAKMLPSQGALLTNFFGIAHPSDANYTALLSGQPPSFGFFSRKRCAKTQVPILGQRFCTGNLLDCLYYTPFRPSGPSINGVQPGQGCVYPPSVQDIGTQLRQAPQPMTAKAYMEDMPAPCKHPKLNQHDGGNAGGPAGYETGSNPFVYFSNWINHPNLCKKYDVALDRNTFQPLLNDLSNVATTPNLSWIGMNLCDKGHDDCPNFYGPRSSPSFFSGARICSGRQPASEYCNAQASRYLSLLVPRIMASPAYKQDGLIAVVWDEANFYNSSPYVDNRACCNETKETGASGLPGVAGQVHIPFLKTISILPGTNRLLIGGPDTEANILGALKLLFQHPRRALAMKPGGGRTGAILLSPFIKPGTVSTMPYNHYSLLRTLQGIFGLRRTGNARDPRANTMGADVFNNLPPRG